MSEENSQRPILVRALWGDQTVVTHQKSLLDVREAEQFVAALTGFETCIFAYGRENWSFLKSEGFDPILAAETPVVDWLQQRGDRAAGQEGRINWGSSMWRHKLESIRLAMSLEPISAGIIWLDWDTKVLAPPSEEVFQSLASGPPFQGRIRQYRSFQCPWRRIGKRQVYHGGCYYFRDSDLVDRAIAIHRSHHILETDEVAVSRMVDEVFFNNEGVNPECHRQAGLDNPLLYSTRGNAIPSDSLITASFGEGRMLRPGRLRRMESLKAAENKQ